jgi:hypothetical protein
MSIWEQLGIMAGFGAALLILIRMVASCCCNGEAVTIHCSIFYRGQIKGIGRTIT